jgi:hypothetical protein
MAHQNGHRPRGPGLRSLNVPVSRQSKDRERMKAYACVYRHKRASAAEMRHTRLAATQDPLLRKFLDAYPGQTSYLDWGDDAAFFSAKHRLGDIRAASWGVCRRDVPFSTLSTIGSASKLDSRTTTGASDEASAIIP